MNKINSKGFYHPEKAKKCLLWSVLLFFAVISAPVYLLLHRTYSQLENEHWYKQQSQAQIVVDRIEQLLLEKLQVEQARPIVHYRFFNLLENPLLQATALNLSPLSKLPPDSAIPGLVGYFQIDPDGGLQIPALPELGGNGEAATLSGLSASALNERKALKEKIKALLAKNIGMDRESVDQDKALPQAVIEANAPQSAMTMKDAELDDSLAYPEPKNKLRKAKKALAEHFDIKKSTVSKQDSSLNEARLKQLNIDTELFNKKNQLTSAKQSYGSNYQLSSRKEMVRIPDQSLAGAILRQNRSQSVPSVDSMEEAEILAPDAIEKKQLDAQGSKSEERFQLKSEQVPIISFETEVTPIQMQVLNGRYLCFFRQAWNGSSRFIQGFIVNQAFFADQIQPIIRQVHSFPLQTVLVLHNGEVLYDSGLQSGQQSILLFQRKLLSPFQGLEVSISSATIRAGADKALLDGLSLVFVLLFVSGGILFYRLGSRQIEVSRQQRNFVSSISHELKTPLTSIRMYAEMLRSDWVLDESRKRGYYDYIFNESERLSRLIGNVLQLARMENQQASLELRNQNPKKLLSQVKNKILVQTDAAGFTLNLDMPEQGDPNEIAVDQDAFEQIFINLVDNAIKFSAQSAERLIDIGFRVPVSSHHIIFYVRDYGPGIERQQMKKIFRLFYRAGDELTRVQSGTGIGLALVAQLAEAMNAKVDVMNRRPGAEFQIKFCRLA